MILRLLSIASMSRELRTQEHDPTRTQIGMVKLIETVLLCCEDMLKSIDSILWPMKYHLLDHKTSRSTPILRPFGRASTRVSVSVLRARIGKSARSFEFGRCWKANHIQTSECIGRQRDHSWTSNISQKPTRIFSKRYQSKKVAVIED